MNITFPVYAPIVVILLFAIPKLIWGKRIKMNELVSHPLFNIIGAMLISVVSVSTWLGAFNSQNYVYVFSTGILAGTVTAIILIAINWNKLRSPFTVIFTYLINLSVTLLVCHILGIGLGASEEKAFVMLAVFLLINMLFFWQSFGMDPQVEDPKNRKSYWLNKFWNYACIFYLISFLAALVRHDIFIEELYVYRDLQLADEIGLQERINEKMSKYSNVGELIREAGKEGNIAEIERLKKFAKETGSNVNQLRKHIENPGWELFLKTLKPVFDLCGLAPSTYNWFFPDTLTYLPGTHEINIEAGQKIPVVLDKNRDNHFNISHSNDIFLIFSDGTKVLVKAGTNPRVPPKGSQTFWIESPTKQTVTLIVT